MMRRDSKWMRGPTGELGDVNHVATALDCALFYF